MEAVILRADGSEQRRALQKKLRLEELQELVGGYIERQSCRFEGRARALVINEEGELDGLPRNEKATACFREYWQRKGVATADWIVGDAVVLIGCDV